MHFKVYIFEGRGFDENRRKSSFHRVEGEKL